MVTVSVAGSLLGSACHNESKKGPNSSCEPPHCQPNPPEPDRPPNTNPPEPLPEPDRPLNTNPPALPVYLDGGAARMPNSSPVAK